MNPNLDASALKSPFPRLEFIDPSWIIVAIPDGYEIESLFRIFMVVLHVDPFPRTGPDSSNGELRG
jgi:hypothetical protein